MLWIYGIYIEGYISLLPNIYHVKCNNTSSKKDVDIENDDQQKNVQMLILKLTRF